MPENQILLTTPTVPYPTLPANDSLTDATGQRFTKGDDIFTLLSTPTASPITSWRSRSKHRRSFSSIRAGMTSPTRSTRVTR